LEAIAMAIYLLFAIFHPQKIASATAATAPLEAIATVILIDIMCVLSNHYSTVNQRAIAMVKQWLSNGAIGSHCNGKSMVPLEAIATVKQWLHWKPLQWLVLVIFHLQKQLSQRLQRWF